MGLFKQTHKNKHGVAGGSSGQGPLIMGPQANSLPHNALALFCCVLLLYVLFLTRTYYWDGVLFSLYIEGVQRGQFPAAILLHPNHLLYSALGYGLYEAIRWGGFSIRAITVLQVLNAILSTLAGWIVFRLAWRLTDSARRAFFCWILFAFGATWWKFSTDADAYVIAVLFLLLAVRFAFDARFVAAGVCHALAMLFHELSVFAYVPLVAAILLRGKSKLAAVYVAATGGCVAAVYWGAYQFTDHSVYPNLFSWVTSRSATSQVTHSARQIFTGYLASYGKLFFGGKLVFIREYFSVAVVLALAVCVTCVIAFVLLLRGRVAEKASADVRVLWIWVLSYALFLAWWEPASAFYKLFLWPPLVLLMGAWIRGRSPAFLALAGAMAAWNFGVFVFPHSHVSADPVLALAKMINREMPKDATVYYSVLSPDDWYLEYFAPGRTWRRLPIEHERSGTVCVETTALDELGANSGTSERRWELVNSQHRVIVECLKH
jgi:hypothetical protein